MTKSFVNTLPSYIWIQLLLLLFCVSNFYDGGGGDEGRVWSDLNMPSVGEFEEVQNEEVLIFESEDEYELEISIGIISGEEGEEDDYIHTAYNVNFPTLDLNQLPPPDDLNMPSVVEFEETQDEEVLIFESEDEYELEISIGIINGEEGEEDDYIHTAHNVNFPTLDLNQLPPDDEDEEILNYRCP